MSLKPLRNSLESRNVGKSPAVLSPTKVGGFDPLKAPLSRGLEAERPGMEEKDGKLGGAVKSAEALIELPSLEQSTTSFYFEPLQLAQTGSATGAGSTGGSSSATGAGSAGGSGSATGTGSKAGAGASATAGDGLIGGMSATTVAAVAAIGVVGVAAASSGGGSSDGAPNAAPNVAPSFAAKSVTKTGTEDTVLTDTAVATDVDGTALTYTIKATGAANGTAVVDSKTGKYSYTPKANYNGDDKFVIVASDGVLTAEQEVNVKLAAVNDAPVINPASTTFLEVPAGESRSFVIDADDVDVPAQKLTPGISSQPANGKILEGNIYQPNPGFTGNDKFTVSVSDGVDATKYDVSVKVGPNLAPTFAAPVVTVGGFEDELVTGVAKASDPEGSALVHSVVTAPTKGTLTLAPVTGAYTYTPNKDYNGADSFVVSAKDPFGNVTATNLTVNLNLAAINDAPRFAKTSVAVTGTEDTVLTGTVGATDPEGTAVTYSIKAGGSTSGAAVINKDTGAYSYTPKLDVNGSDSFVVLASDGTASSEQTVNITLAAVNDAPVITSAATAAVNEKVPVSTVVYTATATDVDENTKLSYSLTGVDSKAFKIDEATGQVTFVASPNYAIKTSYGFNVVASDGDLTAAKSVSLSVNSLATTVSLDFDNDANLNSLYSIDLATGAFRLTDSSTVANAVKVTGLTSDDFLEFTGTASDYSFTYINSSKTLSVSSNIAGTFSSINIAGVSIDTLVTDEATAESGLAASLGVSGAADFFRFASGSTVGTPLDALTSLDYDLDSSLVTVYNFNANDVGTATVAYTDSSKIGSNASISNFGLASPGVGDTITVDTSTSSWSFTSSNKTATTVDIDIAYNNAGTISLIKLLGAAPATVGLVNSEATAELAVGYDFFKSSETVNANVALDLPSGDLTLRTLDAGTGANQYIEDGSKANQVRITNFGGGDAITVINLGNPAYTSTTSGYFSSSGKDILFSNNVNGTASVITLVNAVTIPGLVYDEASAEQAVGFDFISFRFA